MAEWKFLTNHGRALLCIVHDPEIRLRDIAATLGITERSAYSIVNDLTEAGYVLKEGTDAATAIRSGTTCRSPTPSSAPRRWVTSCAC